MTRPPAARRTGAPASLTPMMTASQSAATTPSRLDGRTASADAYAWPAECAGSAGLLLVVISAIRLTSPGAPLARAAVVPAGRLLVVGAALGTEVALFGRTAAGRRSGGDLNPAVTLALWILGRRPGRDVAPYCAAQLAGGCAGAALARLVWGGVVASPTIRYGLVQPEKGFSVVLTAVVEAAMAAALVLVIARASDGTIAAGRVPAVIGTTITVFIWGGGRYSGASFNPTRNFAPAVFSGDWHLQAVYFLAPLLGATGLAIVRRGRGDLRRRRTSERTDRFQPTVGGHEAPTD